MRLSILAWSAAGGALVGLLAGIALFGLGALVGAVVPAASQMLTRFWWIGAALCFALLPLAGGIVGYLEGRLKL